MVRRKDSGGLRVHRAAERHNDTRIRRGVYYRKGIATSGSSTVFEPNLTCNAGGWHRCYLACAAPSTERKLSF